MILKDDKIVIVGSGCFGLSSAYHLLKAGFLHVTVLDRSEQLPAVDGASNDVNRIVRTSYPDDFYAALAAEAIRAWKDKDEWPDCYHESGVLVIGEKGHPKLDRAYQNDLDLGLRLELLVEGNTLHNFFPQGATLAPFHGHGYLNRDSGWVNAAQGIANLIPKVTSLGGQIITNKSAIDLIKHDGKTTGVRCLDGTVFEATLVILATGAWTASAFPDLGLDESLLASGQCLAMVQLTEEEASIYRDCPVFLDFHPDNGYYCFPPNEDNLIKMAIHSVGFTNTLKGVSTPRTIVTDPEGGLRIPKSAVKRLRDHFRDLYPNLANKPFVKTRICWYCDTPDEDWIIGFHPGDSGLIIATGDSGHAYKFLPVIGSLVAKLVQGTLESELVKRFAVDRAMVHRPEYDRAGVQEEIDLDRLCSPEDLVCI